MPTTCTLLPMTMLGFSVLLPSALRRSSHRRLRACITPLLHTVRQENIGFFFCLPEYRRVRFSQVAAEIELAPTNL